jgi:hypothetical protein
MAPRSKWCSTLVLAALAAGCNRPSPVAPTSLVSASRSQTTSSHIKHVLLISVDGLHALDLSNYVAAHRASMLARLTRHGNTFLNVSTSKPSDSWPGLLAIVTGGSPKSTGIIYEVSYDRKLSPPGSTCTTLGTVVDYSEFVDVNSALINGGGGIDPAKLPRDPANGCKPLYPHSYLRVNTIFEVAKAANLHTAWSDKSLGYEVVNGPSGTGVDDLFNPEIAAPLPNGDAPNTNVADIKQYDEIKVQAILNEIDGFDHTGTTTVGVPAIFGMNFQAVSVGQKTAGYLDAAGTPSVGLENALNFVDESIAQFVEELAVQGLLDNTAIVISAKHGQTPIDPSKRHIISNKLVPSIVNGVQPGLLAASTLDDVALLWLTDQSKADAVEDALEAQSAAAGISDILIGSRLASQFNNPLTDSRAPDVIVEVQPGVIYASPTATKLNEHGGFSHDDTNVPIVIVAPGFEGGGLTRDQNTDLVTTAQIAPTILQLLGLDSNSLMAVQQEGTQPLPLKRGGHTTATATTLATLN